MSIRGSLAAATVLASALALSGCSDDSSATESSESPASPTASASPDLPDDAMSTEPARPKDKKTPESAVAFGRHVVESVWYANQQGDASELMALDDDESCTNCASIQDSIEETAAKGHRQLLASDVEITGATLLDRSTDTWVAGIAFTRPKLTEYDEAGKSVGSVGAVEHAYATGGTYEATVTTTYSVSFTLPGGDQVSVPGEVSATSDPVPLQVGEIQAVVSGER